MNENETNETKKSTDGTVQMDENTLQEQLHTAADTNGQAEGDSLEARIEQLESENADLKDQVLRRAADFDNYRKRMIREKQEAFDYANANLLGDLVDSLDNLDRALEAASSSTDIKTLVDGVEMIKKQLVSMLESKYNLVSYGAKGDTFDPNAHEAIASTNAPVAEQTCGEVYLKGYKLKERVIRHAKVQVLMPDGAVTGENQDSGAESKAE